MPKKSQRENVLKTGEIAPKQPGRKNFKKAKRKVSEMERNAPKWPQNRAVPTHPRFQALDSKKTSQNLAKTPQNLKASQKATKSRETAPKRAPKPPETPQNPPKCSKKGSSPGSAPPPPPNYFFGGGLFPPAGLN